MARIRELTREPEAVFWVFVFPILLTAILGLAFRSRPPEALPVAVVKGPLADARLAALAKEPDLEPNILSEEDARQALVRGRVVLVVSAGETPVYSYRPDPAREPRRPVWPSMPPYSMPQGAPTRSPREPHK